jgi:magnesium-transporting ATPase (P-type)
MTGYAQQGLRVIAFACRSLPTTSAVPRRREDAEGDLCLTGLAALLDPPRPEVPPAIERAHRAGIQIHVITGDNGLTAAAIARDVGIGRDAMQVVTGTELETMAERDLDHLLGSGAEVIFARNSPEAKLRIADALRANGHVVTMTGDGVNDAPALRRADIGVAMDRSARTWPARPPRARRARADGPPAPASHPGRHQPRDAGPGLGGSSASSQPRWSWPASSSPCTGPAGTRAPAPGPGSPLNHAYRQATTVAWLGIVTCQIGTAFAVRTDHASLRSVGVFSNRYLLGGIAFALVFAATLVYAPALQDVFGTAALTPAQLATVAPFPFIVWGADELRRLLLRHRPGRPGPAECTARGTPRRCARRSAT